MLKRRNKSVMKVSSISINRDQSRILYFRQQFLYYYFVSLLLSVDVYLQQTLSDGSIFFPPILVNPSEVIRIEKRRDNTEISQQPNNPGNNGRLKEKSMLL